MVRLGRYALIALLTVGYYALLYFASISTDMPWLSIVLGVAPLVALALFAAWSSPWRYWLVGTLLLLLGLTALLLGERIVENYHWFYLAQHAGTNLALALLFGLTLRAGSTPLITRFAAIVHDELTPGQIRYTRQITYAWTLFFVGVALISVMLFLFTSIESWSLFANVLYLPLMLTMFAGEYLIRLRVLPDIEHVSLAESFRISSRYFREKNAKRTNDSH